jgi:tetratricopeptide (TPR) repeat protein
MELVGLLVEAHPNNPKSYSIYADFLVQSEMYEEAKAAFYKVIALDSSRFLVWENLLRVEAEIGDYKALQKDSRRTIDLFPEQPMGYLFNGAANIQNGNYEEAIRVLEQGSFFVVANDLLLAQFYAYLGDANNQLGDNDASDAAYDKVLLLDPNNSYVLNNYAYYLSLREDSLEKAEIMAKKAVQLDPENSANLDTYGWVLYKMKRYKEAKEWVKKALDSGGSKNPVLLEHYGDILYQMGDTDEAQIYWKKAKDAGKGSEFLDKKVEEGKLFE